MLRVFRNGKGPASDVANSHIGAVAQSGEHLLCKQGVRGSNPLSSTRTSSPTTMGHPGAFATLHQGHVAKRSNEPAERMQHC